jgi:hypothetical protein
MLVVSNMNFIFNIFIIYIYYLYIWDISSHWLSYFSRWLEPPISMALFFSERWWSTTGFAMVPKKVPGIFRTSPRRFKVKMIGSQNFQYSEPLVIGPPFLTTHRNLGCGQPDKRGAADPKYTTSTCFEHFRKIWGWINIWRTISSHTNYVGVTHRA